MLATKRSVVAIFLILLGSGAHSEEECSANSQKTMGSVHGMLNLGFKNSGGYRAPVALRDVVAAGLAGAVIRRSHPLEVNNLELRNASYFLQGMNAELTDDPVTKFWVKFMGPAYDPFKYAAHTLRDELDLPWFEEWMRNDPHIPTSPPGGWEWARKGIEFAQTFEPTKEIEQLPHGKEAASHLYLKLPCYKNPFKDPKKNLQADDESLTLIEGLMRKKETDEFLNALDPTNFGAVPRGYVEIRELEDMPVRDPRTGFIIDP